MGSAFIVIALAGIVVAAGDRRARPVAVLTGAIALQTTALFLLARANHAATPYMALKMFYLAIYPGAVAGAVAVGRVLNIATARAGWRTAAAWTIVGVLTLVAARHGIAAPRPIPVVSVALYDAGRWTRAHLEPACVDYLVTDDDTAYWLHLAVLGNPRATPRSLDSDTYEPKQALIRWVLPGGLPYAIVEALDELPKDIRTNVDVLMRFGPAAVIRRRGATACQR
jgi:hypothetical protein